MNRQRFWIDALIISAGSVVMALGIAMFLDPQHILPGGLTGVGMILTRFFPKLPLGLTVLALNLPLFAFGWRALGGGFLARTVIGTVVSSVFIDVFALIPPPECGSLAASVLGGALMGAGLGLVFGRGGTTGGTDMLARMIKLKLPSTQMGALVMGVDGVVVLAAVFVFGSVDLAFYAAASIFVSAKVMDMLLYGVNAQWSVLIVTECHAAICEEIHTRLERGTTLLSAEGGWTGEPRRVILCALRRQQLASLKGLVKDIDPDAFVIVNNAYDVLGEGFRAYDRNQV
ncbi:membrane protein [Clostridia bacterium]|nr:membrane protein [Clostridia bacterium]